MKKDPISNCRVWSPNDSSHVTTSKPIDLKRKELEEAPKTELMRASAALRKKRKGQ